VDDGDRMKPMRYASDAASHGISVEYLEEARCVAQSVGELHVIGSWEHDLSDYTTRIIQEVYHLRSRVAYLEGWKESAEAAESHRMQT
jgi:hypothetical protein